MSNDDILKDVLEEWREIREKQQVQSIVFNTVLLALYRSEHLPRGLLMRLLDEAHQQAVADFGETRPGVVAKLEDAHAFLENFLPEEDLIR